MNKFTKTLVAVAVTGLMTGPASAVDFAVYTTQKASVKFHGPKCETDRSKNIDMILQFGDADGFDGGPNTGVWESEFFTFGEALDGEGPVIAYKPGKDLAMDLTGEAFLAMLDALEGYADESCKDSAGLTDGMINRFETLLSKNGSKATLKFRAEGTYFDFISEKERVVKLNVDANLDSVD